MDDTANPRVRPGPGLARFVLRGADPALDAVAAVLGCRPGTEPCRAAGHADRAALWLGPDEWLLLLPAADPAAAALPDCLGDAPGCLVDVGHRQTALLIEGTRAAALLSAGCPLDLHPAAFPPGMCTRTVFAKAGIVLWRRSPECFHLEVARSFSAYVQGLLAVAAREYV